VDSGHITRRYLRCFLSCFLVSDVPVSIFPKTQQEFLDIHSKDSDGDGGDGPETMGMGWDGIGWDESVFHFGKERRK